MARSIPWRLLDAVFSEDAARVRELLAAGADPNRCAENMLPLVEACRHGTLAIAEVLLDAGADIELRDDQFEVNPLMAACSEAQLAVVRMLLARGANPNAMSRGVSCPLRGATSGKSARRAKIVAMLLDAGADPRQVFHSRCGSPVSDVLMSACDPGGVDSIRLLLDAGADVNANHYFGTLLIAAAKANRADVAELLLARGADPTPRLIDDPRLLDWAGKNALELAKHKRYRKVVEVLKRPID